MAETPDYTTWPMRRLTAHQEHLSNALLVMAGQNDPVKPQIRAELVAIREEITRRAEED